MPQHSKNKMEPFGKKKKNTHTHHNAVSFNTNASCITAPKSNNHTKKKSIVFKHTSSTEHCKTFPPSYTKPPPLILYCFFCENMPETVFYLVVSVRTEGRPPGPAPKTPRTFGPVAFWFIASFSLKRRRRARCSGSSCLMTSTRPRPPSFSGSLRYHPKPASWRL